jgi:hypothetical protein
MKPQNKAKTTWNIIKTEIENKGKNAEQINNSVFNPDAINNCFLTITKKISDNIYRSTSNNSNESSKPIQYLYQTFRNPSLEYNLITHEQKKLKKKVFISYKPKILVVMVRFQ